MSVVDRHDDNGSVVVDDDEKGKDVNRNALESVVCVCV